MRLSILIITALSILTTSCSIQKRTFRNGYYVSWNRPALKENKEHQELSSEKKAESKLELRSLRDSVYTETSEPEEKSLLCEELDLMETESHVVSDSMILKNLAVERQAKKVPIECLQKDKKANSILEKHSLEEETRTKKLNLFAINSLVFAIGYVILSFITIYTSLFALAIISFLLALCLAIVAIVKWKRNKGDFWGTFFAVIALGLLVLGTLILLLFILAGSL